MYIYSVLAPIFTWSLFMPLLLLDLFTLMAISVNSSRCLMLQITQSYVALWDGLLELL